MVINDLDITLSRKAMKSIRITIKGPDALVRVSAPFWVTDREIRSFILAKWDWIIKSRAKVMERSKAIPKKKEYITGEKHLLFGEFYEMQVIENSIGPAIQLRQNQIFLFVRPGTTPEKRGLIVESWYRTCLQKEIEELVQKWSLRLNEPNVKWGIRKMKARWGSCSPSKRSLLFNLGLACVPLPCVEYVVVHEFTHLQECHHNNHFKNLMSQHLPEWPKLKKYLNIFAQKNMIP